MLYHARALAASGVDVDLVGFEGTPVPKTISGDPRISIHRLNPPTLRRGAFAGSIYAVAGLLDAAGQGFRLWRVLRRLPGEPRRGLLWTRWTRAGVRACRAGW